MAGVERFAGQSRASDGKFGGEGTVFIPAPPLPVDGGSFRRYPVCPFHVRGFRDRTDKSATTHVPLVVRWPPANTSSSNNSISIFWGALSSEQRKALGVLSLSDLFADPGVSAVFKQFP
ncbi:hypothetical protein VTK56DRAFT_2156 [Thermocarpiscus australiensis]